MLQLVKTSITSETSQTRNEHALTPGNGINDNNHGDCSLSSIHIIVVSLYLVISIYLPRFPSLFQWNESRPLEMDDLFSNETTTAGGITLNDSKYITNSSIKLSLHQIGRPSECGEQYQIYRTDYYSSHHQSPLLFTTTKDCWTGWYNEIYRLYPANTAHDGPKREIMSFTRNSKWFKYDEIVFAEGPREIATMQKYSNYWSNHKKYMIYRGGQLPNVSDSDSDGGDGGDKVYSLSNHGYWNVHIKMMNVNDGEMVQYLSRFRYQYRSFDFEITEGSDIAFMVMVDIALIVEDDLGDKGRMIGVSKIGMILTILSLGQLKCIFFIGDFGGIISFTLRKKIINDIQSKNAGLEPHMATVAPH